MLRRPTHVTIVDALRMDPIRRLEWVLFRLREAGLTLRPKLDHFPAFYRILASTMPNGKPHAQFDLAKKLFTHWAMGLEPAFALPAGRIETWPLDIRVKVCSVTKGKDIQVCPCGRFTDGSLFCSVECGRGQCKTCKAALEWAPVEPEIADYSAMWKALWNDQRWYMLEMSGDQFAKELTRRLDDGYPACRECSEFERLHGVDKQKCHTCLSLSVGDLYKLQGLGPYPPPYSHSDFQACFFWMYKGYMEPQRVKVCTSCRSAKRQRV
jgi:hypothetical protein